jgi:hypothetical protein
MSTHCTSHEKAELGKNSGINESTEAIIVCINAQTQRKLQTNEPTDD